jgi:pilus assembly protein CpaE
VRQALLAAVRGERPQVAPPLEEPGTPLVEPATAIDVPAETLSLIALASGHGSPGRTTLAVSLAAALGAIAPTVLVDADLSGPSIAAYLDADPTRNLYMLAHAEPESPREWERAIAQETQPLGARSPQGVVLCGVPKPEMRTGIAPRFFERLVGELRQRYRYVILDTGADLLGPEAAVHRTALGLGQQVLLVAAGDVVGLWHGRTALGLLRSHLQVGPDRVALVINRHDRRHHHGRMDIEWALGVPTAAVIPYDHGAAERAITAQRPLVLDGRSRASRAVLDLAERVHGGNIVLPPEPTTDGRARWRRWLTAMRPPWARRNGAAHHAEKGAPDGDYATPVT